MSSQNVSGFQPSLFEREILNWRDLSPETQQEVVLSLARLFFQEAREIQGSEREREEPRDERED